MSANNSATLFLVATPIGNLSEMTPRALEVLKMVDVVACEDTRNSLKLMTHFDIHTRMITYHNFNEEESTNGIIKLLKEGKNIALISDAGYPLISDPGYLLVNKVIEEGFNITTISGPSAGINALVASGLNTNHYMFYGFLNSKQSYARKELESLKEFPYTIIFYEAPHRYEKTLLMMKEVLGDRKACLARELTKMHETYHRGLLSELCELKDLKGEMVIIVSGYEKPEEDVSEEKLMEMIEELVKSGVKAKVAAGQIADKYSLSKNQLYNAYIKKD